MSIMKNYEVFQFEAFANSLNKARVASKKYKCTCCIPGCNGRLLTTLRNNYSEDRMMAILGNNYIKVINNYGNR